MINILEQRKSSVRQYFAIGVFLLLIGCSLFEGVKIEHVQAEIISIERETDTSAVMLIRIFANGNAQVCSLAVLIEKHLIVSGAPHDRREYIEKNAPQCQLDTAYRISIGRLEPNTKYYFQLHTEGTFDIGGPSQGSGKFVGEQKTYHTP